MKILFTGGGTGGHVFPIIAIVREIKRIASSNKNLTEVKFYYCGPKDEISASFLKREGIEVKRIISGKVRRYLNPLTIFQNFIDILFKIPIGIFQALFYIFFLNPDIIFSKGGYGSIPSVIIGWLLQIPIFLHESDASPGMANRFLSKFSLEIFVSFPVGKTEYFLPQKVISVGNPIRKDILWCTKEEAKETFKLVGDKPLILILGGSQGSQRINELLLQILPEMLINFEVIQQTGQKNFESVKGESSVVISESLKKYYHIYPFLDEKKLCQAYAAADLIVSRAGAGSIFEIAAMGKPSILIPLPESAQNHQVKNAYIYAKSKAALVIEEANLTPHFFLKNLKYLFEHQENLEEMARMAKKFSKPRAAEIIAEYILSYLTK